MNRKEKIFITFLWITLAGILALTLLAVGKNARDKKGTTVSSGYFDSSANQEKIDQLNNVLAANPNDFNALVSLGDIYYDMKNADKAIEYFLKAEQLKPDDTHVLDDLGFLYSSRGNNIQAIAKFKAAYNSDPSHLASLYSIARIYMLEKQTVPKAVELLKEILSKNPDVNLRQAVERDLNDVGTGRYLEHVN
jgi:cytochrome c-type biogenesis protein CcmH/NrfG